MPSGPIATPRHKSYTSGNALFGQDVSLRLEINRDSNPVRIMQRGNSLVDVETFGDVERLGVRCSNER